MFRNKVAVRVEPPLPLSASPFVLRQLRLRPSPGPATPPLVAKIESLCWRISRSLHIVCLFLSPEAIAFVYQKNQAQLVKTATEEIALALPIEEDGEEDGEELSSGSLLAKAVECGLKSFLLNRGWRCVGTSYFIKSSFCSQDERRHLHAFNVAVQSEIDNNFIFLVSADVVRFNRYKITDLASTKKLQQSFKSGEELIFEGYDFSTSCSSLPALHEANVIGLSKMLPAGEDFSQFEELWSLKNGLELPSEYYINIQLSGVGHENRKWLPSSFVLQGAGFSPAPQSVRIAESVNVLKSFIDDLAEWEFFGQGKMKIKGVSSLTIGLELPTWTTSACCVPGKMDKTTFNSEKNGIVTHAAAVSDRLFSGHDFRAPKPVSLSGSSRLEQATTANEELSNKGNFDVSDIDNHGGTSIALNAKQKAVFLHRGPMNHSISSDTDPSPEISCGNDAKEKIAEDFSKKITRASKRKENSEDHFKSDHISDTRKRDKMDAKRTESITKEKSQDDVKHKIKKKMKLQADSSDITGKVMDCHMRGRLDSLTVAELKCFLVFKKVKVGGKKQDLIERISALLA